MDLSLRERDRISVLRQVGEGVLTPAAGAARLGVTPRHFRRMRRRFEAEGDAAVVHGLRERRSNRLLPAEVRERAMAVATDPLYRDFGPTLLAEHLDRTFGVRVSGETLRSWMLEDGLWERRRRRAKHRGRRERRAALGELGQWDSSVHRWLEDRAGEFVLISIHDDATSRLMMARFVERDNGAENRRTIIAYLRRHGRPLAVYTDHAGHFGQWLSRKEERTDTIMARGLGALGVEVILAGSPQAKGRVERSFGTAQDRLIKEMRVAGVGSLGGANRFLAEWWTPFWNERFTVAPRDPADARRPMPAGVDTRGALRGDGDAGGPARLHDPLPQRVLADPGAGGRRRGTRKSGGRGTAAKRGDPHPNDSAEGSEANDTHHSGGHFYFGQTPDISTLV